MSEEKERGRYYKTVSHMLKCDKLKGDSIAKNYKDQVAVFCTTGMMQRTRLNADRSGNKLSNVTEIMPILVYTIPGKHMLPAFKQILTSDNLGDVLMSMLGNITPNKTGTVEAVTLEEIKISQCRIRSWNIRFCDDDTTPTILVLELEGTMYTHSAKSIGKDHKQEGVVSYTASSVLMVSKN